MNLNKPAFWDSKQVSLWSILLMPLTVLYCLVLVINRKIKNTKKFNIKIIFFGNIYIGGTGKTPLTIKIASLLKNKFKVAIIKKNILTRKMRYLCLKKNEVISTNLERVAIEQAIEENYKSCYIR